MGASRPSCCQDTGVALSLSTMAPQDLEAGAPRHAEADMQTLRRQAAWPVFPGGPWKWISHSASLQVSHMLPCAAPQFASHQPQSVSIKAPLS